MTPGKEKGNIPEISATKKQKEMPMMAIRRCERSILGAIFIYFFSFVFGTVRRTFELSKEKMDVKVRKRELS